MWKVLALGATDLIGGVGQVDAAFADHPQGGAVCPSNLREVHIPARCKEDVAVTVAIGCIGSLRVENLKGEQIGGSGRNVVTRGTRTEEWILTCTATLEL